MPSIQSRLFFLAAVCAVFFGRLAAASDCQTKVTTNTFSEEFLTNGCINEASVTTVNISGGLAVPIGLHNGASLPDASTLALFHCDDAIGGGVTAAINSAGELYPGSIAGGVTSSGDSMFGTSFNFDGTGSLNIVNQYSTVDEVRRRGVSFLAWLKPRSHADQRLVVGSRLGGYSNPGFYLRNDRPGVVFSNSGPYSPLEASSALGVDSWHHVAASYSPHTGEVRLYVDGSLERSATIPDLTESDTAITNAVGSLVFGAGQKYDGLMDEVWLRLRPLYQAEATDLANEQSYRGSFESEQIETGGTFNTLTLNVEEADLGTAQIYVDTGSGWRQIVHGTSIIFDSTQFPPFSSFRYKLAFPARSSVDRVAFSWNQVDYSESAESFSFLTVSDTYSGHENSLAETVRDAFARDAGIDFIIATGDFENFFLIDSRFQAMLTELFPFPRAVPWASTTGNHVVEQDARVGYLSRLLNPRFQERLAGVTNFRLGPSQYGRDYSTFSFDYRNAHFILLEQYYDSAMGMEYFPLACIYDDIFAWLEQDLHQNTKPFIFLFGHEGAFPIPEAPYNNHYGDSLDDAHCPGNYFPPDWTGRPARDRFWNLLKEYKATAHYVGHSHAASAQAIHDSDTIIRISGGEVLGPEQGVLEVDDGYGSLSGEYHITTVHSDRAHFARYAGNGSIGGFSEEAAWDYYPSPADACGANPKQLYADPELPQACNGTYSVARRDCSGTDGDAYPSLDQASHQALAGDTVWIRGATYREILRPWNSGAAGCPISFRRYAQEPVLFTEVPGLRNLPPGEDPDVEWSPFCIYVYDKTHIVIDGVHCEGVSRWARVVNSRDIAITNSIFREASAPGAQGGINFLGSSFCRLDGNTIEDGNDNVLLAHADNNVISNNRIIRGRHTLWAIKCGNHNVVRGNYFHNPIQKIGEVFDCEDDPPYIYNATKFNLIEGNTFAYTPGAVATSSYNAIQFAGQKTIVRNNIFYDNEGGALALTLYEDEARYTNDNRVYNNVFFNNHFAGISISRYAGYELSGNIFKNNILYRNNFVNHDGRFNSWAQLDGKPVQVWSDRKDGYRFEGNLLFNQSPGEDYIVSQGYYDDDYVAQADHHPLAWWQEHYPDLYRNNLEYEPGFINVDTHDFHLRPDSQVIDRGVYLTKTTEAGSGQTLRVEDALYFYAGNGAAGELGDEIQLAGQSTRARIVSINHASGELTLDRQLTWTLGQGVALTYEYAGPDLGAFEHGAGCSNGVQDGTEAGVDCGGDCRDACAEPPPAQPTPVGTDPTVAPLEPDLVLSELVLKKKRQALRAISLRLQVDDRNQVLSELASLRLEFHSLRAPKGKAKKLSAVTLKSVALGRPFSLKLKPRRRLKPGRYFLRATINSDKSIGETSYDNNFLVTKRALRVL